ncbi:GNAT family N-acetyltransferase [uncultured Slackia sp.]|uniref:GNAT family N-acetyltransferase n=1 Tax=uncultured Slackia sp. TaxID=665903 RepID=UPI0026DF81DF|nr:GNAT family N-acetyltransferase [uncultured Slackia sp.]
MHCRIIESHSIDRGLFSDFIRRQDVDLCRRWRNGAWTIEIDPFVDDWDEQDYQELIAHLRNLVERGGLLLGAFSDGSLKGFVSVDPEPLGPNGIYRDLCDLFVSADMRGQGIGRELFRSAARWARKQGADKLYLSSHSAIETQAFYESVGCIDAAYISPAHVEKEPFDCQLEYDLRQTSAF